MSNFKTLNILLACLVIFVGTHSNGMAIEAIIRRQTAILLQQADELSKKAIEAAKQGDLTTSQQNLNQIDTLTTWPLIKTAIQNSPTVQEAKKKHLEAEQVVLRAATQKTEVEKQALEREKQQEIANRIAFEKEQAQKQLVQRQEDEKKAALRQQQQHQPKAQQTPLHSPQTITHQDGKSFASFKLNDVVNAAKSTSLHSVPGFQTDKPKEASFKAEDLGDAALMESKQNTVSQHLISSAQDRQKFKLDPNTDPLFVNANQSLKNPQDSLNEQITEGSASDNNAEEIKTCEEGGEEYQQTCTKRLEIVLKITQEIRTPYRYCPPPGHPREKFQRHGFNSGYVTVYEQCGGCATGVHVTPKKVEIVSEKWIDGCTVFEDHAEKGLCRYVSAARSPKNETRVIQGEAITREHFEEHYIYACFKTVQNSCTGLREQGCYQIKSVCKEKMGDHCALWQQSFSCPTGKKSLKSYKTFNKENPFCLTGDCADTSYEANDELLSVMSHLYTLREAQNDLKNFSVIFKGQHRWCTRNCLDFRDCCGNASGWGVTLSLSSCDKAEVELRTLRDKNLCVQVGTYCAERDKVFNSCLRKKTTFCCYGTKLARLIQQNGRAQLNINWGTPEHPTCERGFSPEELSRIDFSKVNFAEIFGDIKDKMVPKDQKQSLAEVSSQKLQDNMTLLTKPSQNSSYQQKQQALREKGL